LSIILHSNNRNCQESQESPGLSTGASYKLRQKLHWNDNPGEASLLNNSMEKCKPVKSGTEPVLKSQDDFWVGDGADLECTIRVIDRQGTTPAEFFGEMTKNISLSDSGMLSGLMSNNNSWKWGLFGNDNIGGIGVNGVVSSINEVVKYYCHLHCWLINVFIDGGTLSLSVWI